MVLRTASGWNDHNVTGLIFGQLYHTPVSILEFWGTFNDGDFVDLGDYFQNIYSVFVTPNQDASGVAPSAMISGSTYVIFYDGSGLVQNVLVFGHKAENAVGLT